MMRLYQDTEQEHINHTLESGRLLLKSACIVLLQAIILLLISVTHIFIFAAIFAIGIFTSIYGLLLESLRWLSLFQKYLASKSTLSITGGHRWI